MRNLFVSKKTQKKEALKRMIILDLLPGIIREFEKENKVQVSYLFGGLYDPDSEQIKLIKEFEEKHKALVYHTVLSVVKEEKHFSLFYVSKCRKEWKIENEILANGESLTYTYNLDSPHYSEFGYLYFKPFIGGILRII